MASALQDSELHLTCALDGEGPHMPSSVLCTEQLHQVMARGF